MVLEYHGTTIMELRNRRLNRTAGRKSAIEVVTTYRYQNVSAVRTHGQGMTPPSEAVGVIVQRIAIDRAGEITLSIGATLQNFWSAAASGRDTPDKTLCHTLSPPPHAPQPAQQRGARCVLPARPPSRARARPPAL